MLANYTPTTLLAEFDRLGIEVKANGDRLRFRPRNAVSDELLAALRQHKTEILETLTRQADSTPPNTADVVSILGGEAQPVAHDADDPPAMLVDWFERTTSADGSPDWKWFPLFQRAEPLTTCHCCGQHRWWRSIYGPHLICGVCHPPAFANVVAEWITNKPPDESKTQTTNAKHNGNTQNSTQTNANEPR